MARALETEHRANLREELGEHKQKHAGQPRSTPSIPHKDHYDCAGHGKTQMRCSIVTSSKIWQHGEELGEHRHQDARILHFRALGWLQDRLHGHRIIKRRSWSISSHSWTDSLQNGNPRARALYMQSSFFLATPMDKDSSVGTSGRNSCAASNSCLSYGSTYQS